MYSVYQHWDPLKVCIVGRSYSPEFYSWITIPKVRSLFEQIAIETEEDYQAIIKKLQEFNVEVLRPEIPADQELLKDSNGTWIKPPMCPRDFTVMVGTNYYENYSFNFKSFYNDVKDSSWPNCNSVEELENLPKYIRDECYNVHGIQRIVASMSLYNNINQRIQQEGNTITSHLYHPSLVNGAQISRIGKDLFFGTESYNQDTTEYRQIIDQEFKSTRNHIINTGGHGDSTYCPVCPGLIISLHDVPTYADTFPNWEVVYLPEQSWAMVKDFLILKEKNRGRWWIPGFERDQDVVDTVEQWLGHWTGYVEETVFDVNMLIIDPKNVMVFNYNKQVFDALGRYGITPHIVPFRHRYFWDGGIHCITSDLHREGTMQDYFPGRG